MKNHSTYFFKTTKLNDEQMETIGGELVIEFGMEFIKKVVDMDINENTTYMFCFMEQYNCEKVAEIYRKFGFLIDYYEVSNDILFEDFSSSIYKQELLDSEVFQILTNNYKKSNLTIDIVLDKIGRKGIDSLNVIDKSILETT
jgi:hypothetical protein